MANETGLQTASASRIERHDTFAPRNMQEAFAFADMVLMSGMAPKSYNEIYSKAVEAGRTPEDAGKMAQASVVVALQFGMEVGFQPMQALQCIANINGQPSVWGDGALALTQSSGLLEWIKEDDMETIKKNKKATCQVKRRGDPEVKTVTFSYDDAIAAGIMSRGVWKTYPHRMCQMRARAFALRDKFADVLKGLKIAEEVMDYVDLDAPPPVSEKPAIQATVVVPTAAVSEAKNLDAPAVESKPENQEIAVDETPTTITIPQAKDFYKAYSASGYLPEESKAWLKEKYGITDSRLIKLTDFEECMKWASTPKPEENMDAEPTEEWTGTLPNE